MRRLLPLAMLVLTLPLAGQAPSNEALIRAALLPLPEEFRETATVLGWSGPNETTVLRRGTGRMICLADDPAPRFHVACYHDSLEPFMARGRQLRANGMTPQAAAEQRNAEIDRGTLAMPMRAALWQLTGPPGSINWETMALGDSVRSLYVIYIPGGTGASTGLPETPARGVPWVMFPGTPRAHIMFIPEM
jgi:hypothetical protein